MTTPQPIRISLPRLLLLLLLALLPLHAASSASNARIGVFTLFHPQELELTPDSATLVYLTSNGHASRFPVTSPIRIRLSGGTLECDIEDRTITADKLELSPRGGICARLLCVSNREHGGNFCGRGCAGWGSLG